MKKVVTSRQMGEIDRLTTEEFGVPSIDLMENAARSVFEAISEEMGGCLKGKQGVVLCGKGNNGGDGAALARMLRSGGATVSLLLMGRVTDTRGDARVNFERYSDECVAGTNGVIEIGSPDEIEIFWSGLESKETAVDVIVDAVFGTGLTRPVEGIYRQFLEAPMDFAGSRSVLLVSIDLPSGLDADNCETIGFNFRPDLTVTFTSPKMANAMAPAALEQGRLIVSDIGSPFELVRRADSNTFLAENTDVAAWLEKSEFSTASYKKKRGTVLIAAGSIAYAGAAVLAANGAIRSGAGIVTVAVPEGAHPAVSSRVLPEVMVKSVTDTESGTLSPASFDDIADLRSNADSFLIGCGLTREPPASEFVKRAVAEAECHLVIDADGLNAISPLKRSYGDRFPIILTPHEGEFRRLAGTKRDLNAAERIETVREFSVLHNVICVLKGERTITAAPDGTVVINPTGNSGLGKAGNGDNLAGIIAGFVAQTVATRNSETEDSNGDIIQAVVAAVYIAGLAGDIAARQFGKRVMTASDVRDSLAAAFAQF